jgi:hypothetical protein
MEGNIVKGILEFNLPEEQEEFDAAAGAGKLSAALFDVRQQVFRPARKHGYSRADIQQLVEKLDLLVVQHANLTDWPRDEYQTLKDATYLISLLEGLFNQVLEENGVAE